MREMTMNLVAGAGIPMYEQIYRHIRDEILSGGIERGERLPSSRSLSLQLEVSRSTVDLAYAQLVCEGYVESRPCKGYFACGTGELYHFGGSKGADMPDAPRPADNYDYDMKPVGIDLTSFPFDTWRKINRDLLTGEHEELLELGDPRGELPLRESICRYIHQSRGVDCRARQVVVGSGNDYLIMLLSFLLGTDKKAAMESPGYRHAYDVFRKTGFKVETIPMDGCGMDIAALKGSGADIAYVMPSHQFPLGLVTSVGRRQELLDWAADREGRYIIEDDYDSEFRYRGKPIPAMQGQSDRQCVIYMGTFSQSVAPAIRISYLVLPEPLVDAAAERLSGFSPTVSRLDQTVLDTFIREGHFERHLNRMRRIYSRKHDILLTGLRKLGRQCVIGGERAGVHLTVSFKNGMTEEEAVESAASRRVKVYPLSDYVLGDAQTMKTSVCSPCVLVGYAGLNEDDIEIAASLLCGVWDRRA